MKDAPDAIGPYCHAMKAGNLVYCSGWTPLDPNTMTMVDATIEEQTHRVLDNRAIVLAGVGLNLKDIVKTTAYLHDMNDFQGMNMVYAKRFVGHKPSRPTIAIKKIRWMRWSKSSASQNCHHTQAGKRCDFCPGFHWKLKMKPIVMIFAGMPERQTFKNSYPP